MSDKSDKNDQDTPMNSEKFTWNKKDTQGITVTRDGETVTLRELNK